MRKAREGRSILIVILCVLSLGMGIGFASMESTLQIGGTAKIVEPSWNVGITSISVCTAADMALNQKCATPVGSALNVTDGTGVSQTDPLKATFTTTLALSGDNITYKVVITNNGTIKAKVSNIAFEKTYDETTPIMFAYNNYAVGDTLKPGESKTIYVNVSYMGTEIAIGTSITNTLYITYVQAD